MSSRIRATALGRLRTKGIRDLEDMDARGRLADTASPIMHGTLIFLAVVTIALVMYSAGRGTVSLVPMALAAIAAFGVGTASGVALASARYHAVKQLGDAQMELLALHGELELERTERRALIHDARAVVGAMGAAIHALDRSGLEPEIGRAMASQVNHLREVLATPVSVLRAVPLDAFREALVSFANLHGLSLSVDLPAQVHVMAEPASVATILQNLADNARKHAPGSPVRVFWEPAGAHVRICVEDQGPGVGGEAEALFGQGARGRTAADGYGLGLATARRLAEKNQGALWYEHRSGPGSRFVLKLMRASASGRAGGTL